MSGNGKRSTILVVDDQTNVRNILEFNLKRRGFDILSAQDGLAAITMATNHLPSLILLDIMMPGIDGFQVLEKLRSTPATAAIPVLVVSAKGTEEDILKAMKLGARDYIVKPFNLELLMQKVFKLLASAMPLPDAAAKSEPKLDRVPGFWNLTAVAKVGAEYPSDDAALADDLVRLAEAGARLILLDLSKTGAVPAIAFGKLAKAQQMVRRAGGVLKLVTGSEQHRQTLAESNFLKHFEIHADWIAALKEIDS